MCVLCWWRRVSFLLLCLIVKEWSGNLFNVTESPHRKVWSFRITLSPSGLNRFFHGTSMIVIFRVKSHQIWPMISPMPMFHTKQSIGSMTLFVRELLNSYIAMKIPFQRRRFPQNLLILQGSPTSAASPKLCVHLSPARPATGGDSQVFLANAKHSKSSTYAVKVQTSRRTATKKIEHEAKIWKLCASHRKLGLWGRTALWCSFPKFPSHSNV